MDYRHVALLAYSLLSHRTSDETAAHAEQQEVLLSRSELEGVRRQVASGLQTTYLYLLYHQEQTVKTKHCQSEVQATILAEAIDRLRYV